MCIIVSIYLYVQHYHSSLQGSVILLISCIVMTCIIGAPLSMTIKHCFFVVATLSLASASLMQQFIERNNLKK